MRKVFGYSLATASALVLGKSLVDNDFDVGSLAVVRLGRAGLTVFDVVKMYKRDFYHEVKRLNIEKSSEEYSTLRSQVHKKSAERILELCRANKGVYIKVGQHIGALEYLVPIEYVDTMKVLHSNAPRSSLEDVMRVLREEFKCEPQDVFSRIEPEPQGTASLAQVHKAWLKDGRAVAVKVQHPFVRKNSAVDLTTMEVMAKFLMWVFPDFDFQWLVNESKKNIPLELDFVKEAGNMEKVRELFKHFSWLKIPEIYPELSTTRVLTMEFTEGGQVNDLEYMQKNNIDVVKVSDNLGRLYSQMIFNNGFVHSDPHPGNILVHKSHDGSTQIVLLDHGLYATLSNDVRWAYSKLWLGILNCDENAMKDSCESLGVARELYPVFSCMVSGRTWEAILSGLSKTKYTLKEKELFQIGIPSFLSQVLNALANVNCQLLLILKTNDLLRGIEHTLKTQARNVSFLVMSRCCIHSVYGERLNATNGRLSRFCLRFEESWILLKLTLYYTYLSICDLFSKNVA
ncbi:aarF domain-containing kinase 1 [Nilaparvata lugens]|uniref:aarF domain-containing kinase 1 n=1 Tax=Nilaparvata lugens TaxID=108931 RepID=UPI00193DA275|nr:aarF domain-containing kinase 1 [Nilaparvata lugens]